LLIQAEAQLLREAKNYQESYDLLHPMLDLTTTLDPRFNIAYRFGSVFLSEPYPSGPGRSDLSIALLEKGLRTQPTKWAYMQDIGFVHYWYDHDYRAAADAFRKASEMPGAPWWLASLAATTLASGGDRQSSCGCGTRFVSRRKPSGCARTRNRRSRSCGAQRDRRSAERGERISTAGGRAAAGDWSVLVRGARLRGVPLDPSGSPHDLTPDGR
jgi:hypothetical protein